MISADRSGAGVDGSRTGPETTAEADRGSTARSIDSGTHVRLQLGASRRLVALDQLLRHCNVDGIIRLRTVDFTRLGAGRSTLTLFNLGRTTNRPGLIYLIGQIVEGGSYAPSGETVPVMSLRGAYRGRCRSVEVGLDSDHVPEADFRSAFEDMRSPPALRSGLRRRYASNDPRLPSRRGEPFFCSVTRLVAVRPHDGVVADEMLSAIRGKA